GGRAPRPHRRLQGAGPDRVRGYLTSANVDAPPTRAAFGQGTWPVPTRITEKRANESPPRPKPSAPCRQRLFPLRSLTCDETFRKAQSSRSRSDTMTDREPLVDNRPSVAPWPARQGALIADDAAFGLAIGVRPNGAGIPGWVS